MDIKGVGNSMVLINNCVDIGQAVLYEPRPGVVYLQHTAVWPSVCGPRQNLRAAGCPPGQSERPTDQHH